MPFSLPNADFGGRQKNLKPYRREEPCRIWQSGYCFTDYVLIKYFPGVDMCSRKDPHDKIMLNKSHYSGL